MCFGGGSTISDGERTLAKKIYHFFLIYLFMKIYIILPCYNESASLGFLLQKICSLKARTDCPMDIIAVDDGSTDNTGEILRDWSRQIPITIIKHKINRGLGETSRDGFEAAADLASPEDIIIRMDADNTHEPDYIPSMVKKIREGYEIVIASRFQKGGGMLGLGSYRTLISLMANMFMKCLFPVKGVWEYSCGFRAYRAELIQTAIRIFGDQFISLKGVGFTCTLEKLVKLRMLGAKVAEVPFVLRYDQKSGSSKMVTSITTLGYLLLALKYIYPWGPVSKKWIKSAKKYKQLKKSLVCVK